MAQIVVVVHCPTQNIKDKIMKLLSEKKKQSGLSRSFILLEALKK